MAETLAASRTGATSAYKKRSAPACPETFARRSRPVHRSARDSMKNAAPAKTPPSTKTSATSHGGSLRRAERWTPYATSTAGTAAGRNHRRNEITTGG